MCWGEIPAKSSQHDAPGGCSAGGRPGACQAFFPAKAFSKRQVWPSVDGSNTCKPPDPEKKKPNYSCEVRSVSVHQALLRTFWVVFFIRRFDFFIRTRPDLGSLQTWARLLSSHYRSKLQPILGVICGVFAEQHSCSL